MGRTYKENDKTSDPTHFPVNGRFVTLAKQRVTFSFSVYQALVQFSPYFHNKEALAD